jgi:hypothetical protein
MARRLGAPVLLVGRPGTFFLAFPSSVTALRTQDAVCAFSMTLTLLSCWFLPLWSVGVGNAIDSSVMAREYFAQFSVPVLGAIFNKIPRKVSYHTYEKCKEYVTKFFAADNAAAAAATGAGVPPARTPFGVYGFVPIIKDKDGNEDDGGGACAISCALRKPSKVSLAMTEEVRHRRNHLKTNKLAAWSDKHIFVLTVFILCVLLAVCVGH